MYNIMSVTQDFKELNRFVAIKQHLIVVLNNFKDESSIDLDSVFDLIYIQKVIENWISSNIQNKSIENSLKDTLCIIYNIKYIITRKISNDKSKLSSKDNLLKLNKYKYNIDNQKIKQTIKQIGDPYYRKYYCNDSKANSIFFDMEVSNIEYINLKLDRIQYYQYVMHFILHHWNEINPANYVIDMHCENHKYKNELTIKLYYNSIYLRLKSLQLRFMLSINTVENISILAEIELQFKELMQYKLIVGLEFNHIEWRY